MNLIVNAMTCNQFAEIKRFIHFVEIYEFMSSLNQYLKSKPKKWGFKICVQARTNGYVHCFELHQGDSKDKKSLFGPIGDTVLKLCQSIH